MEAPQQIQTDISAPSVQVQDAGVSVGGVQASPDVETTSAPAVETPTVEPPQLNDPNGGGGGGPVATQPVVEPPQLSRPGGGSGGGRVSTQPVETPELSLPDGGGVTVGGSGESGGGPVTTQPVETPELSLPSGGSGGGAVTTQPVETPDLNLPDGGGVSVGGSDESAPVDVPELSAPSLNRTNRPRGGNTGRSGRQRGDRGGGSGGGNTGGGNGLKVVAAEGKKNVIKNNLLYPNELVSENGRELIFRVEQGKNPWVSRHNLRDLRPIESIQVMDLSGSTPTPVQPPQTGTNGIVVEVKEGELYNFEASFMNTMGEEKVDESGNVLTYRITVSTPPEALAQRLKNSDIVVSAEAVNLGGSGGPGGGESVQDIIEYGQTLAGLAEALNGTLQPLNQIQSSYPEDIASRAASLESDVRSMVKALNQEITRVRSWLQKNTAQPTTKLQPGGGVSTPQLNAGVSVGGSVPELNTGGGASIPELNTGGGASVPALNVGGSASVSALDAGGDSSFPARQASIPTLDTDTQGVTVGGVDAGGSLPELSV